jgi:hypothetical protein
MYWPLLAGILLMTPIAWRYIAIGQWERYVREAALGVFGFISTVAAEETAEWTGRYSWTYESFWTYPPNWLRMVGILILCGVNLFGFRS